MAIKTVRYFVNVRGQCVSRVMERKGVARRVLKRLRRVEPLAVGIMEQIYR